MKKVVCLLLSILLTFTLSASIFAENENAVIDNEQIPGATVEGVTYNEPYVEITDLTIPESSPGLIEVADQEVPLALPDTGGIPAEAFYVAGALLVVAALMLLVKKDKADQKN